MATVTDWARGRRAESGRAEDGQAESGRGEGNRGDRAQLVLVGALALAVSLVVLAVVLNSAIYTENLASRSGESGTAAAVDARQSVRDGVGGSTDRVNRNHAGDDYGTLSGTHLPALMDEWRPMMARQQVVAGRTLRVTTAGSTEGTRIADESVGAFSPYTTSGFEGSYGEYDWMVASTVEVRQFRLSEISASDLQSEPPSFDPDSEGTFFVEIHETDGSDVWLVGLYDDGGRVGVMVWDGDKDDPIGSCQAGSSATVDLTGATLGGQHCEALSFFEETEGPLNVYYHNGDQVVGTYELTVDRAGHVTNDAFKNRVDSENYGRHCAGPTYADSTSNDPYASAAIYSTTVDFRYVSESVTYETEVRVARGEPGPEPKHPRITDFSVTDNSDSSAVSFDITWSTTDPNGDSVNVEATLHDLTDGSTDTQTVSGGSATLSESSGGSDTEGSGHVYEITLRVSDGTNERTDTEAHQADGEGATGCPP